MLVFNKYFYKNKKSKLYFGDRVVVLNDFIYQTGGSNWVLQNTVWCVLYILASVQQVLYTTHSVLLTISYTILIQKC
jgi:hypothetical protein